MTPSWPSMNLPVASFIRSLVICGRNMNPSARRTLAWLLSLVLVCLLSGQLSFPTSLPPAAPSCLSATGVAAGQINLAWVDNSDNETGFRIERKLQGGSFSQIAVVGTDSTSYADASVGPGAYCYRVYAYNAVADSAASNEHCSTTTSVTSYEKMYITDFGAHEVVTANLDGSARAGFGIAGCESHGPLSIAINPIAGKLYVSNWTEHKIIIADLDGENAQTLTQLDGSIDGPNHIALDIAAGKMYIANENTNSVTVANLDGSSPVVLDVGGTLNEPYGVALDVAEGKMYVQNYSGAIVNIVQANLDGSFPVVMDLDGKLSNSRDIALDLVAKKMYVVNTGTNSVTRANLDGTCAEVLHLGGALSLPYGIALDVPAGRMYVVNYGSDNVVVASLDGSNAQILPLGGPLNAANDIELGSASLSSPASKGDVNGDGLIDLLDVRLCLQLADGVVSGTSEQLEAADVDEDGDVDKEDAEILAGFIIGIRLTLP